MSRRRCFEILLARGVEKSSDMRIDVLRPIQVEYQMARSARHSVSSEYVRADAPSTDNASVGG
jgi:hypothetical protein